MSAWSQAWERYWFHDIEPHAYAAIRIGLGIVGILGLVGLTPVDMYWPADSLAPVPGGGLGVRELIVDSSVGPLIGYVLYAALWLSFVSMVVGFKTSTAVAFCFIASAIQGFWNPLPLSSSHKVLVALLFCLMWADCGRVLSVDVYRDRASENVTTTAVWPLRLIRVQMALIYFSSGLTKLFGDLWRDGSALHYTLQLNAFHRFPWPVPGGLEPVLTAMTYATVFWELGFVVWLLNRRTRALVLWFGVFMHVGMALTMELGTFSAAMLVGYIAFVDPATTARYVQVVTRRFSWLRLPVKDRREESPHIL